MHAFNLVGAAPESQAQRPQCDGAADCNFVRAEAPGQISWTAAHALRCFVPGQAAPFFSFPRETDGGREAENESESGQEDGRRGCMHGQALFAPGNPSKVAKWAAQSSGL